MTDLFLPYQLGSLELANRLVMAPLTRNRAGAGEAPTELAAEYYAQRAAAGLIISEGTQPSAVGQGYPHTPGLHTDEQVAGWTLVADAVHARGGRIVAQLMHAGRISHPAITGRRQRRQFRHQPTLVIKERLRVIAAQPGLELPEVLGMADRIVVLFEGSVAREFTRAEADEHAIMRAATEMRTASNAGTERRPT